MELNLLENEITMITFDINETPSQLHLSHHRVNYFDGVVTITSIKKANEVKRIKLTEKTNFYFMGTTSTQNKSEIDQHLKKLRYMTILMTVMAAILISSIVYIASLKGA